MANYCDYYMIVKGEAAHVEEFIRAMSWEGEYENCGVGRVYDCDVIEKDTDLDGLTFAVLTGNCAWSIISAMRIESNENNIEKLSARLNLAIEAYSSECGCEFQEHYCVINGVIQCDDCIDYTEICIEDLEEIGDDFWEQSWIVDAGVTKENAMEYAEDDWIKIGGYDSWTWEFV